MTLIDTAEIYGDGAAEEVVAEAIDGQRDSVFVVSKVYPPNASRHAMAKACEGSLRRLRVDTIDLYLLHWRSQVPLSETIEAFEELVAAGKVRRWGVSNFDREAMMEVEDAGCAADQVLYHLGERGIEFDLLPWSERAGIPIMAYTPIGRGKSLLKHNALVQVARDHDATPAQVALAWVLRNPGVIAIPKASEQKHVRENAAARDLSLTSKELAELDLAFPPPQASQSLAML